MAAGGAAGAGSRRFPGRTRSRREGPGPAGRRLADTERGARAAPPRGRGTAGRRLRPSGLYCAAPRTPRLRDTEGGTRDTERRIKERRGIRRRRKEGQREPHPSPAWGARTGRTRHLQALPSKWRLRRFPGFKCPRPRPAQALWSPAHLCRPRPSHLCGPELRTRAVAPPLTPVPAPPLPGPAPAPLSRGHAGAPRAHRAPCPPGGALRVPGPHGGSGSAPGTAAIPIPPRQRRPRPSRAGTDPGPGGGEAAPPGTPRQTPAVLGPGRGPAAASRVRPVRPLGSSTCPVPWELPRVLAPKFPEAPELTNKELSGKEVALHATR
nr:translation initiation factor IF-2-like [Taeniopygia guttata]